MASPKDRLPFSERVGARPTKPILQLTEADKGLRMALWNVIFENIFEYVRGNAISSAPAPYRIFKVIWTEILRYPLDELQVTSWPYLRDYFRNWFFGEAKGLKGENDGAQWHDVYECIEIVAEKYSEIMGGDLRPAFNDALEREKSAYRFIGDQLTPISAKEEIAEVKQAITAGGAAAAHIREALDHLGDRDHPKPGAAITQSILAVEAQVRVITGRKDATLGDAIKLLDPPIHGALKNAFSSLYGYTSDQGGLRHSLKDDAEASDDPRKFASEAQFMLIACSAFVNYLRMKFPQPAEQSG